MEIKPSEGIAQILELIGSVTVAAPADYTKNIHIMKQQPSIYMGKVGEAVKHAHLGKNNQNRFASHRLHRWLFRIAPVDQRVSVCAAGYDKRTSSGVTGRNRERR